eukprot:gene25547-25695_t
MVTGAAAAPATLLVLGDSLTAGLGLAPADAFPAKLEAALKAKGHDVKVINAGVSGDTAADGAARLDWALGEPVDGVIVELGANDALRGLPVAQAEQALDQILESLKAKKLPVLLAGMRAPPNLGPEYQAQFDGMYARLAQKYGVALYSFFLEGVAADPKLFTGVEIPDDVAFELDLMRGGISGARWIDRESYHITLRFIGDIDEGLAREISYELDGVEAKPFKLRLT